MAGPSVRPPDGRWQVDRVAGDPAVAYRVWDEGQLAAECADYTELEDALARIGYAPADLEPVDPEDDPWCE